ncbi:MAG: VWA domain-containing protein [Deltaproteobacteria bacterium]|nr:VWA domain-containing protein [Deltaproteobacteria bacterium]
MGYFSKLRCRTRSFCGCAPLLALTYFIFLSACTDSRLEYPQVEVISLEYDDELTIKGSFCASPAADIAYPVKIMFIVDGSGSLQFSDQNRQRVVAVENAIGALLGQPNVYFKIIVFNAAVSTTPPNFGNPVPPPVFTNDLSTIMPGLIDLTKADTLTDYQGALAVAYAELLRDMTDIRNDPTRGPAELGRTKYVIIFISDGFPDPQCKVGAGNDLDPLDTIDGLNDICENQDYINCTLHVSDEVDTTVCNGTTCTYNNTLCWDLPNYATLFGGLSTLELMAGNDYNQPYQILAKVQDIMDLASRYGVGEMRMHTGLVLDPQANDAIIQLFGDPAQAIPLVQEMANIGDGLFMQFYGGDQINFLQIDYQSLQQPRVVRGFIANNLMALPNAQGYTVDTDGDGLSDAEEIKIGTKLRVADTDGDGYSDAFEEHRRSFGFDPLDACMPKLVDVDGADPLAPCDKTAPMNCNFEIGPNGRAYIDTDRDGIHDCEENNYGLNSSTPDTDHDGIPDPLELAFGTDPLLWDYERDFDGDGIPNGRESTWHLPPLSLQSNVITQARYRYDLEEVEKTVDGRPCYDFVIRHIKLAPTKENNDLNLEVGHNNIRLYIVESMADNLAGPPLIRTACINARYIPPSLKVPAGGEVQLSVVDENDPDFGNRDVDERFFKYLWSDDPIFNSDEALGNIFDPTTDCITPQ